MEKNRAIPHLGRERRLLRPRRAADAPPGTPGEYLTVPDVTSNSGGINGPIGLGFRVPMMIISPFSRGGFLCSDVFDHTSFLRFLETRFGVEVPNLSAWRRENTGDLTSAFNFVQAEPAKAKLRVSRSRRVKPAKARANRTCR